MSRVSRTPDVHGYDSSGRENRTSTTRDSGATWDETLNLADAGSGLVTNTVYADGGRVSRSYSPDGRLLRTDLPGYWRWRERTYDGCGRLAANLYADPETAPPVTFSYTDSDLPASVSDSEGNSYLYAYSDALPCTNETVTIAERPFTVSRSPDGRGCPLLTVISDTVHGSSARGYAWDAEGRLAEAVCPNAAYAYTYDEIGDQKSAKPKPKARGDRDFKATPQEWSEERYSATQRTSKERKAQAGARGDRDFKATPQEWSEERYSATQQQHSVVMYISESGAVSAEYEYDPFGKVVSHTGRDFDFQFSTKFYDPDIGMYYYGYRHYSPELRRWASPDPIGEEGGLNLYGFCGNLPVSRFDMLGEWSATRESYGKRRRVYKKEKNDKFPELARKVGLDVEEINYWAKFVDGPHGNRELFGWAANSCYVSVPNVWISADLLRGGGVFDRFTTNLGGTLGRFFGTTLCTPGSYLIVKPNDVHSLINALDLYKGDVWGLVVFGHGSKTGILSPQRDLMNVKTINQNTIIKKLQDGKFKIAKAYMMQCYSEYSDPVLKRGGKDFQTEWRRTAIRFWGYEGVNVLMIDF